MVELDERVIDEISHEGEARTVMDILVLIERHHPEGRPGVSREAIEAYVGELASIPDYGIDEAAFFEELDDRLTDARDWAGTDRVYELEPGRISVYPARWHDRLGGTTDVAAYVAFLTEEVPEFKDDVAVGGAGPGIPEQPLLDVVSVVGGVDREEARAALEALREQGKIVEDADQHPNAGVYLRDDHEEYRDGSLDS